MATVALIIKSAERLTHNTMGLGKSDDASFSLLLVYERVVTSVAAPPPPLVVLSPLVHTEQEHHRL